MDKEIKKPVIIQCGSKARDGMIDVKVVYCDGTEKEKNIPVQEDEDGNWYLTEDYIIEQMNQDD